jgi:hypothetical protein
MSSPKMPLMPKMPPMPPIDAWDSVPFDSGRWQWHAAESRLEDHLGRRSLYLKGGIATVAGARFADGIIELDVAFTGERGFVGGVWRVQDSRNYEEFYLRPHQSGNPDANQYTPVFNGLSGWQLYHGERYTVPVVYRFNEWIRMRIAFSGARAAMYIDDLDKPVLVVEDLKRNIEPGGVGVSCLEHFAPAHFSNFSFLATDSPPIPARPATPEPVPEGVIPSWWVSDLLAEKTLEGRCELGAEDVAGRSWSRLETERSGLANLARVQGINFRRNTAFARKVIHSDREQVKRLDFGFSDRVRVYLNGRLLFHGNDTSRSRDYRFLGSIGYFDALYLPLAQGENELLMAVSEDSGGWGIQAKLEDLAGITLRD